MVELTFPTGQRLRLEQGDLTRAPVDAIVNNANAHLQHGGGLAGAIVRAGGQTIQAESDAWVQAFGPAGPTRPALTSAGRLPARAVIHAVGPVWRGGEQGEAAHLAQAYRGALALAAEQGFASVGFASISTGIFGYPVALAAPVAVQAVREWLLANPAASVREVRFVIYDAPTVGAFETAVKAFVGREA
jgi:O-acetyl-ADP-ribose deacetylase (regulator of RNase III)